MFDIEADPELRYVLDQLGMTADNYLGHGGEAWVGSLGADRVARILHAGCGHHSLGARQALVDELARLDPPFALPRLLEHRAVETRAGVRHVAIEKRLPGASVLPVLPTLDRSGRDQLVVGLLEAVRELGRLPFDRDFYGDLLASNKASLRSDDWTDWLQRKAEMGLQHAGPDFDRVDAASLAEAMPRFEGPGRFLHLDAYPGNVMAVGTGVTAIIDVGHTSAVGDPRLDLLSAGVYLCEESITPTADGGDRQTCHRWLGEQGLLQWFEPTRRWLAAFWSWATDDPNLHAWCRQVLLDP